MNLFEENREALQQYVDSPNDPDRRRRVIETMRLVIEALQLIAGTEIATFAGEGFAVFIAEIDRLRALPAPNAGVGNVDDVDQMFEIERTRDFDAAHDRLKGVLLEVIEQLQKKLPG